MHDNAHNVIMHCTLSGEVYVIILMNLDRCVHF